MPRAHFTQSSITPTPKRKDITPTTAPTTQAGSLKKNVPNILSLPIRARRPVTNSAPTTIPIT